MASERLKMIVNYLDYELSLKVKLTFDFSQKINNCDLKIHIFWKPLLKRPLIEQTNMIRVALTLFFWKAVDYREVTLYTCRYSNVIVLNCLTIGQSNRFLWLISYSRFYDIFYRSVPFFVSRYNFLNPKEKNNYMVSTIRLIVFLFFV